MDDSRRCTAKSKQSGERCKRAAIVGGTVCKIHGGGTPVAKVAAERRQQEDAARRALANLGEPEPIDPAQALLNLIAGKHGEVLWLRAKVREVEPAMLTWGATEHREGVGPEGPISVTTEKAQPSVWWSLLRQAEDQLAEYASKALRAGIEERRLRIAERQGEQMAGIMRRVLDALGLSPQQQALVPVIVPQAFRELEGETA